MSFNEWKEVKLEDVVDTISKRHKFDKDKIILINTSDVLEGKVLNHEYVQNENLKGQFKKSFQKNDILYSEIRPQNKRFAYVDFQSDDYVASTKLMVLRKKNEMITSNFLYQILKSDDLINELQVIAESRSGTFPQITYNELSRMKIKLPPLDEQKAIAHILSTLDDKIEVNNQINKTLESMAQAIFKQWFVDFEFPNEDGEPYKPSGGEMVETELGMIPKGWEVVKLNSVVDICYGKNLPTKKLLSDGYPVFGGNGQIGFYSEYLYEKSQVLIACRGAASGKVIVSLPYSFVTNNSLILEQNGTTVTHEYLKQFCLEKEFYNYATGSAQPQITIANLAKANILIPHRDLMNMFSLIRNSIDSKVLSLFNENNKLVDLRDTLLPKLMSGEIRVPLDEEGEAS